ncbi:MAG: hypothetical protein KDE27_23260 [Planctomycetes bacterium]|nr:hypothetical protein [Planctomycetota bacterium]
MRHSFHVPFSPVLALAAVASLAAGPLSAQEVQWWQNDFDGALAAAANADAKMLLLYFWRDPNDNCKAMFGGTLSDKKVVPAIAEFVCMGAKADTEIGKPLFEKYRIEQVPTTLFLQPDGAIVDVVAGYLPVSAFLDEVNRIKSGDRTIAALRDGVAKKPEDFAVALQLVRKLRATGDKPGSIQVIDAMVERDPKMKDAHVAEAMLLKILDEVRKPDVPALDWDLEPLRRFLAKQRDKRVKFLGYDTMAAVEFSRDNLKEAAKHAQDAWKNIPDEEVLDWGQRIASVAFDRYEDIEAADKKYLKLALKISETALAAVEKECQKSPDDVFLANGLFLHAAVLVVNNKRKEAFEMMDRAIELNPTDENLKDWKKRWISGEKKPKKDGE